MNSIMKNTFVYRRMNADKNMFVYIVHAYLK